MVPPKRNCITHKFGEVATLRSGSFGTVFGASVFAMRFGTLAIKVQKIAASEAHKSSNVFEREISAYTTLQAKGQHKNVLECIECFDASWCYRQGGARCGCDAPPLAADAPARADDFFGVLVFPMADMNLRTWLYERGQDACIYRRAVCDRHMSRLCALSISDGLSHIHNCGIIHRDLKPENVLVFLSDLGPPVLKIADLGSARKVPKAGIAMTTSCCTFQYAPIEILLGSDKYSNKVDVWSCGCMFAELLTGLPPFWSREVCELLDSIELQLGKVDELNCPMAREVVAALTLRQKRGKLDVKRMPPGPLRQQLLGCAVPPAEDEVDIIIKCLDYDHLKRPTATQLAEFWGTLRLPERALASQLGNPSLPGQAQASPHQATPLAAPQPAAVGSAPALRRTTPFRKERITAKRKATEAELMQGQMRESMASKPAQPMPASGLVARDERDGAPPPAAHDQDKQSQCECAGNCGNPLHKDYWRTHLSCTGHGVIRQVAAQRGRGAWSGYLCDGCTCMVPGCNCVRYRGYVCLVHAKTDGRGSWLELVLAKTMAEAGLLVTPMDVQVLLTECNDVPAAVEIMASILKDSCTRRNSS